MKMQWEIDILKKAREIIAKQNSIAQGVFYSKLGDCYCTMGAIVDAYADGGGKLHVLNDVSMLDHPKVDYFFSSRTNYVSEFTKLLGFESQGELFSWNDKQTDKQAILDKFDATIARLEMEGQENDTSAF